MASCLKCEQEIVFKPHPRNPEKTAPFDLDGEIHFARCRSPKPKTEYKSVQEFGTCSCGEPADKVAEFIIATGERRLVSMCKFFHKRQIHMTESNRKLINHRPVDGNDWIRGGKPWMGL